MPEREPNKRELEDDLRRQESEVDVLRSRSERAPARLRQWLESRVVRRRTAGRRRVAVALASAGVVALAVTLALALPDTDDEVTVVDAAEAATLPPTAPAPSPSHKDYYLLERRVGSISFPNWHARGWNAVGERADIIDGRKAVTVSYKRGTRRIAYMIVPGTLPIADALRFKRAGVAFARLTVDDRVALTWRRRGHTCVLVSDSNRLAPELVRLASGTVRY